MADIKSLADQLYGEFKASILGAITTNAADVVAAANSYIVQGEQRLKDLAINALNEDISYSFVVLRLKEEEITLKDSLIGIEQMVASDIQALVNKLIGIFEGLLKSTIIGLNPAPPL